MKGFRRWRVSLTRAACAVLLAGCASGPCAPDLSDGDEIQLLLTGPHPTHAPDPSCEGLDGLETGALLRVALYHGAADRTCGEILDARVRQPMYDTDGQGDYFWISGSPVDGYVQYAFSDFEARIGGCDSAVKITYGGLADSEYRPNFRSSVVQRYLVFQSDPELCGFSRDVVGCSDTWLADASYAP